jgi:hypothetical protein
MAFCPNCGTPNTEQAEKCVACGFELIVPKQKAKFKGTIMMSGIKAPTAGDRASQPTAEAPPPAAAPAPTARMPSQPSPADRSRADESPASGGRNLSYQKTMLGPAAGFVPPTQPRPAQPAAPQARAPEPSQTPTFQGSNTPPFQGAASFPSANDARSGTAPAPYGGPASGQASTESAGYAGPAKIGSAWDSSASGGGFGASTTGGRYPTQTSTPGYESTLPPAGPDKPNPGKILAIGCAVALALFLVLGALVNYVIGPKIKAMFSGGDADNAEAAAWQASISQSLAQVTGLCQVDCNQAGVFFHPDKQAALLSEARALTPDRLQKFGDPKLAEASMLDGTDDAPIATSLGLDPQQCARVVAGSAKVISCSVPDVGGKPSVLRIVHLSGISSL